MMHKLRSYVHLTFRYLMKQKFNATISILGLSFAFALTIISGLVVWDVYSSERHWQNSNAIYKPIVAGETKLGHKRFMPMPLGGEASLASLSSDIAYVTSVRAESSKAISNKGIYSTQGAVVDNNFLNVFNVEVLQGNVEKSLMNTSNIVVTKELALRQFGEESVIGKTLEITVGKQKRLFNVGAVIKNIPPNSRFLRYKYYRLITENESKRPSFSFGYVLFKEGFDLDIIASRFQEVFSDKYPVPSFLEKVSYTLEPMTINSFSQLEEAFGSKAVKELFWSGIYMLIISLIGFTSLYMVFFSSRVKDIAIRRSLGATTLDFVTQYFLEIVIIISLSYLLSLVFAEILIEYLRPITGKHFALFNIENAILLVAGWIIAIILGGVSALFPIGLSTKRNIAELFGNSMSGNSKKSFKFRSSILLLQSLFSFGLLFVSVVMFAQTKYTQQGDKGFSEENLIYFFLYQRRMEGPPQDYITLEREISKLAGVTSTGTISSPPFSSSRRSGEILHPLTGESDRSLFQGYSSNYLKTMGIKLIRGEEAKAIIKSSSTKKPVASKVMINEAFVQKFYSKQQIQDVLGTCLYSLERDSKLRKKVKICNEIVGIVSNHRSDASNDPIKAFVYIPSMQPQRYLTVKFQKGFDQFQLEKIKKVWQQILPNTEFRYRHVSELIKSAFKTHNLISYLIFFVSIGSLFLTATSLYSTSNYIVEQRKYEIAIRKLHGAKYKDIMTRIILQLLMPVSIGSVIGIVIGWNYASRWLETYSIRVEMSPLYLLSILIMAVCICFFASFWEINRAINTRPAEILRHD